MRTEFDVSDVAWEIYRLMYAENLPKDFKVFENKRKYISEKFKYNTIVSEKINFSGDTDFNFTYGFAHSRLECYENFIIKSNNRKTEMNSDKLGLLKDLTYSIVNISLMPQTGNLQSVKQGTGNDRIDTFIWAVDQYYRGNSSLLINYSSYQNISPLKSYLNIFGGNKGVYNYCKTIYHINESLVDKMIDSGKQAIDTLDRVINFMDLAFEFWCQKLSFLSHQVEISNSSLKLKESLKEVQEKMDNFT